MLRVLGQISNVNPQDVADQLGVRIGVSPAVLMPMFQNITVLKQQDHYLAEHHLYGSVRLGMQTYGWGEAKSV